MRRSDGAQSMWGTHRMKDTVSIGETELSWVCLPAPQKANLLDMVFSRKRIYCKAAKQGDHRQGSNLSS